MNVKRLKHLALLSVVAAFSLLAYVFSTWTAPFQIQSSKQISHSEQLLFCSVPTSATVFLAEYKARATGFGSAILSSLLVSYLPFHRNKTIDAPEQNVVADSDPSRPLWLLHRSLLI